MGIWKIWQRYDIHFASISMSAFLHSLDFVIIIRVSHYFHSFISPLYMSVDSIKNTWMLLDQIVILQIKC